MHGGFLTVAGQKMSKSLGNFITIEDLLKRCKAQYLRFMVVKNLWQSSMDYSESAMIEVKSAIDKVEEFLRKIKSIKSGESIIETSALIKKFSDDFYTELSNNFNTPKAFAVMFEFIGKINELLDKNSISKKQASEIYKIFQNINKIFGIINFENVTRAIPLEIKKLAKLREQHRKNKDWKKSDELRNELESKGYIVEDTDKGPVIKNIS